MAVSGVQSHHIAECTVLSGRTVHLIQIFFVLCFSITGPMGGMSGANGKADLSGELKAAIAAEVRAQIVPVVKEIVREVVTEVRGVMTEVMAPIYDELHRLRNGTIAAAGSGAIPGGNASNTTTHAAHLHAAAIAAAAAATATSGTVAAGGVTAAAPPNISYPPDSSTILAELYAATNNAAVAASMGAVGGSGCGGVVGGGGGGGVSGGTATACSDAATAAAVAAQNAQLQQFLKENAGESYDPNKDGKMYEEDGGNNKNSDDFIEQPTEPRARESTSDCAAYNYTYYNTASAVPILSMLEPGSNTYVCQKVPSIFLGKEGGKISFLVDTRAVPLKDLTADNLGSWTCRFTAHMKSRKYLVKKGKVMGHVKQYGQAYQLLQNYDYILHRQYYCHGNTVGPATIRKNIWYLSDKLSGGEVVGCAIISYEIGDNATVKISKLRQRTLNSSENLSLLKTEVPMTPEDMDVSNVTMNPNAELQRFANNIQIP